MSALAIVVPIYIYPLPGAWDPLIEAAKANPAVLFICIVNPNNGPGSTPLPDASYAAALTELCALPNVQPLGYVHCTYAKRDPVEIKADIDRYADWEANSGGAYRVDGVFIDEAPWEPARREDMALLARYIRNAWKRTGSTGAKTLQARTQSPLSAPSAGSPLSPTSIATTGVVIYNPGVVVAKGYLEDADRVVVFEQSHQHWYDYFLRHGIDQIPSHLRHKAVAMVHSFGHLDKHTNAAIVAQAKGNAHKNGSSKSKSPRSSISANSSAGPMSPTSPVSEAGDSLASTALTDQIVQLGFGGIYVTDQMGGGYTQWPAVWHTVAAQLGAKLRR